jgi:glutaminyl-peptide cyclotransferase
MATTAFALFALACGADAQRTSVPPSQSTSAPPAPSAPPVPPVSSAPSVSFDDSRAWEHLKAQVALGPRPAGSPALEETRRYITAQLKSAGLEAREQRFTAQTPLGPVAMTNLVATIPGQRPERIVIGTHYDTKRFQEFRFVGANDGASSTAVVLELARVLAASRPAFTIEVLFLDGEEAVVEWQGDDNTYGSRHYVAAARGSGTLAGLKAFVLVDMVGDKDLRIRRDSNSTPWLVDVVWEAAARRGHRSHFPDELTTIADDHVPFLRAGVPSVDIIDLDYAAWHTANDTLDNVSQESLQIVGDVILEALPHVFQRLQAP